MDVSYAFRFVDDGDPQAPRLRLEISEGGGGDA
jgi:hypothetical protein